MSRWFYWFFSCSLIILLLLLGWGWFAQYATERRRVKETIENDIQKTAEKLQERNTTLNNMVGAMEHKDYKEIMGFAIGMTKNLGKLALDDFDDSVPKSMPSSTPPLEINKHFLDSLNIKFVPTAVKTIDTFSVALTQRLKEEGAPISYSIRKMGTRLIAFPPNASEPFIINFYDPVVYRVIYTIPSSLVLNKMWPYTVIGLLLLALVSGAFLMYHWGYRLQLQMSQFKDSLFSNITHELKTPITSLQLIVGSLRKETADTAAQKQQEYINFAESELNRMLALINKLLSFSKLNEQQFELTKEIINTNGLVTEAIQIMQPQIANAGAQVVFHQGDGIDILGDKTLLINVIVNLIDNAIKYNLNKPVINITIAKDKNNVMISVQDNGTGISTQYYKKIFEPFFRIPSGNIHATSGHGIGLSFVQQAVKLHHGHLSVTSNIGTGSTFIISLPAL